MTTLQGLKELTDYDRVNKIINIVCWFIIAILKRCWTKTVYLKK